MSLDERARRWVERFFIDFARRLGFCAEVSIRCSVFVATSLDGFISRSNGDIDWLNEANRSVPPGEDCGFAAFFRSVDALVMGRLTFEQVLAFEHWPYDGKQLIVLSRSLSALPSGVPSSVSLSNESPKALLERLEGLGVSHVYVDGGQTVQAFLNEGLIDEMTLTLIPIVLGEGKPLFSAHGREARVELVSCHAFPFGFVQCKYRFLR